MDYYRHDEAVQETSAWNEMIARVYLWMFLGLVVTGVMAFITINTSLADFVFANRITFYGLMLVELGFVWFLSSRAMKMPFEAAFGTFLVYSALNGMTLSVIFYAYTLPSIGFVFFISAGMFGFMSVYGLVTKSDLTSVGNLLMAGLIGIIIASLVNWFMQSSTLSYIISFVGVAVFLGLTAYDTQKIKKAHAVYAGTGLERNASIIGALALYLDFINLFLFILRILGRRR